MKKNELKKILPKGFTNSKFIKNALSICNSMIEKSIKLESSTFWEINCEAETKPKTIIILSIEVFDKYSELYEKGHPNHIMEVSINQKGELIHLVDYQEVKHWESDDIESISLSVNETIMPQLIWITTPKILIKYLKCLEESVDGITYDDKNNDFKSLLNTLTNFPINVRKTYNGIIATLYEELNDYKNAMKHLKLHKKFLVENYKPTTIKSFIKSHNEKIKLIEAGILSLGEKLKI